ncbi:MAG: amidohydrolase, partial [Candidatus Micrarchaeota archaeon]
HGDDLPLNDWLNKFTWPREAKMSPEDIKIGAMLAICEMLHSATTCFNEHYFHMGSIAQAVEKSGMRACLGYSMIDRVKFQDKVEFDFEGKGEKELEIAKKFAKKWNGGARGRISVSVSPHSAHTCSKGLLEACAGLANELGCILHAHAAETKEELRVCKKAHGSTPIGALSKYGCLGNKTVLAHAIYVNAADISHLSKSGSSVCLCPVSNMKLASGSAPPVGKFISSAINLAVGTDGAASNNSLNLFESMKFGALVQKNIHENPAVARADDYLQMGMQGGARALHLDCGEIKEGKLADIAMLDLASPNLAPFANNAGWLLYAAGPQNVLDVIIDGKFIMREGKILTFDEGKILASAQKIAEKLN